MNSTGVTVRKHPILVKIGDFWSRVTLTYGGWPCKATGHLFYITMNESDGVSNHQPHDCLLKRLFGRRSKKTSKFRVTSLCVGNSPGTGEFPAQRASNAENVSIWWHHHDATSSFVHHFIVICEFKLELQSGNTLWIKIGENMAPFLWYFKRCSSFHGHLWIKKNWRYGQEKPKLSLWPWPLTSDVDLLHGRNFC